MERSVPQYVHCSVPVPSRKSGALVQEYLSSLCGYLPLGRILPEACSSRAIGAASLSVCLWGLLLAGLLSFGLYYYVPAMLGNADRLFPLFVVWYLHLGDLRRSNT